MQSSAGHTTTYSNNRADGDSINIYGDVYGGLHLPGGAGGPGGPAPHQCLRDLRVTDPREDRARIEHGKDRLLKDCYVWILDDASFQRWGTQGNSRLLWIKGDPGKGKTMMTMGLIAQLSQVKEAVPSSKTMSRVLARLKLGSRHSSKPCLLAYFFCQSTEPKLNNAVSVLRGLIYMLVTQRVELMRHVQKRYEAAGRQLFEGSNAIYALREILSDILNDASLPTTCLLVDALDECTAGLSNLLHIITDDSLARRSKVKWLVTSRNVPDIEQYLHPDSLGVKVSLEVSASHVSKAVAAFVEFKVQQLAGAQKYDSDTRTEVQQVLRDKAEGTFLWVSLVCKELEGVPLYRTRAVLHTLPPGLDPLYDRMMAQILAQNDVKTVKYCKDILQSITLAYRPLRLEELAVAAGLPGDQFDNAQRVIDLVTRCGSFLTIRQDIVSFIHLSAKDYFTSGEGRQVFDSAVAEEQGRITYRLLDAMYNRLRRDMCNLKNPGVRIQEATDWIKDSSLLRIAYACEYWVEHLQSCAQDCNGMLLDDGKVHSFFQKHLLHWIEAMSLLQKIPEAICAMQKLQSTLDRPESAIVYKMVHDALRFAMWSGLGIQEAPLQVYYAALVFAPEGSIVRRQFLQEMPEGLEVKCGLDEDWGPLLQTFEGHASCVNSVAFSPAGDQLASASWDGTVRVWDAKTWQPLHTLKGHANTVTSVAFSPVVDQLASASDDRTVRVWNAKTGQPLHTLKGHTRAVTSVAFSPAGDQLASASEDRTVRVWDAKTGQPLHTLKGHTEFVCSVAFSPAGDQLASASDDRKVRVWDAKT